MKRIIIISLILLVISIGFYLGYQQSVNYRMKLKYPEAIQNTYTELVQTFTEKPKGAEKEPLLEFVSQYALSPDENLKYILPPYLKGRDIYYRYKNPAQAKMIPAGPDSLYLCWKNNHTIENKAMTFGKPDLSYQLSLIANIYSYEIEGNQTILKRELKGDFIFRENSTKEEIISDLEKIYLNQLHQLVKFRFQEVPRKVYIARGRYQFNPIPGRGNQVEIYGDKLGPKYEGGGGGGDFQTFFHRVGMYLNCWVISEVENPLSQSINWHNNEPSGQQRMNLNPESVLQHLAEQTGLTFTEETRVVKVLFIE
jgi:hypothetical protein